MKSIFLFLLASLAILLAPIQGLLIAVGISICIDTVLGVYKSIKKFGWKAFSSKKLSDVVGKFCLYQAAVILIYIIDKNLLSEFFLIWFSISLFFTKCVCLVLIFIEMVSVKENFEEAFNVDIILLIKKALRRTKEIKNNVDEIV